MRTLTWPTVISMLVTGVLLLAVCSGCAVPPTPYPTSTPYPSYTPLAVETPTEEPSATPEPTETPVPPTSTPPKPSSTPEPTSTPQPTATAVPSTPAAPTATPTTGPVVVFRDDFDGSLGAGWSWVHEDATHWSLTDVPGSLRIVLQGGGVGEGADNLLLRGAPPGDFEISTLVRFTPTSNFQFAGLLVYQDHSNFVQFGRAFASNFVGNGIYLDNVRHDESVEPNYATSTASQSQAHLKLRRDANTYTAYYSENGADWTVIGQHTNNLSSLQVGLVAAQAIEAETTAEFDYFTITTLP